MKLKYFSINWLILYLIIGSILNFHGWLEPTSYIYLRDLIGTSIYVLAWVGILIQSTRNKNRNILKRSMAFWIVMIIVAVIAKFTGYNLDIEAIPFFLRLLIAVPLGLLSLPFKGVRYFNNSDSFGLFIMSVFSLCMFISSASLFLIRRPMERIDM